MRATVLHGPHDVRIKDVADPAVQDPADAVVRVSAAGICGSDLDPYAESPDDSTPERLGHEFVGVVEAAGDEVTTVRPGDVVIAPFVASDGTCEFCRDGLQTSCVQTGYFGRPGLAGGQAEAVRVPLADGTLVKLPSILPNDALLASLLTLSDVMGTAHHAATRAQVHPGSVVTVIGDGAVGLLAVLAARRLGAGQIVLMGRHPARTRLGQEFGATNVVPERGEEGAEIVRDLTGGGSPIVIEAAGGITAYQQAYRLARPGGIISRVGAPDYEEAPVGFGSLFAGNITLTGGLAPVRSYVEELLPDVLDGTIQPGRVFDRTVKLDDVPDGYRAMADREALKVLIRP